MFEYHISYYDPFPYQKYYATSDWDEVLTFLRKYDSVQVHIFNRIRNKSICPYCNSFEKD